MDSRKAFELEKKMISFNHWNQAPEKIYNMAMESHKEGIPTGIAYDNELGWCIIQSGQGPYILFAEKLNIKREQALNNLRKMADPTLEPTNGIFAAGWNDEIDYEKIIETCNKVRLQAKNFIIDNFKVLEEEIKKYKETNEIGKLLQTCLDILTEIEPVYALSEVYSLIAEIKLEQIFPLK